MGSGVHTLQVGGSRIGGEGVLHIEGSRLLCPVDAVQKVLDLDIFRKKVQCGICPVVTELGQGPKLDIDPVLGRTNDTLITAYCFGALQLIGTGREDELSCYDTKHILLDLDE